MTCATMHTGDALDILPTLPEHSVDAILCDPPAGINFMGKDWDGSKGGRLAWTSWLASIMRETRRVLKPGGHALVWALPRTSHWTACALEDAGFEIRDKLYHMFGSGYPKSLDISKAIDAHLGAYLDYAVTKPATPEAQQWDGWGTAIKPAVEEWILCRNPLSESSIARNVLVWGTGGLNIAGCRIGQEPRENPGMARLCVMHDDGWQPKDITTVTHGRWPAHLLLSHAEECQPGACALSCPVRELDEQSGVRRSGMMQPGQMRKASTGKGGYHGHFPATATNAGTYGDEGGASRYFTQFFYCPKASRAERNLGCEALPAKSVAHMGHEHFEPDDVTQRFITQPQANHHPTVKPQALMHWLCRLITPPGGIILDCFAGSGSTGVAAIAEGFQFIGIELDPEYARIAQTRLEYAQSLAEKEARREKQLSLFDDEGQNVPARTYYVRPHLQTKEGGH